MNMNTIQSVYFIGAGGIGMSALVRYFLAQGKYVAGYDRTPSDLTDVLIKEGAHLHFEESVEAIPEVCKQKETTLVVYTPAIPANHAELCYFQQEGFVMEKRAQVLGRITKSARGLCIAGTHGKTTTSTMVAHLLHQSHLECNAFLGGISKNYGTNLLLSKKSDLVVIEADEFDRSFHWLSPYMAVVTATDPDHLDIYGTKEEYLASFTKFTSLIAPGGVLVLHENLEMKPALQEGVKLYTYNRTSGDFHAEHIRIGNGEIYLDFVSPKGVIKDIRLGVPVSINIENGVAAMAIAQLNGATDEEIKAGMESFQGVVRRFDFQLKNDRVAFLTDYAHHPSEIEQSARSIRELYADKKITAIFQPHLYTRTRDFYEDFARSLSLYDEVILTEIYPARELPIPGVTSQLIADRLASGVKCTPCKKEELVEIIREKKEEVEVLVLLGAGDADRYVPEITEILKQR